MNQERRLLLTLAAIQFTHIVDFMIMMPLGPQLMRLMEIGPDTFGMLVSSYTFSAGLFGFTGAFFLDRFDRKQAIQWIFTGFLLGTLACSFAPDYQWLMAARILTGAFGGLLGTLILSIVGDAIPLERRASAMGIVMTAFSIASVAGVPAGLWLSTRFSWHAPFLCLAILGLPVQFAIWRYIPEMRTHIRQPAPAPDLRAPFIMVKNSGSMQWALLLQCFMMLGHFCLIPFLSPYMVSNVGFSEKELPLIYLLGGVVSIISLPLIGRLADRYGRYRVFVYGILLSAIPQLLITNMSPVALWIALSVTTLFFITTGGRTIPGSTMITSAVSPARRGSFMSLNVAIQQIASGAAAYIGGLIIVKEESGRLLHYDKVGMMAIGFSLCCLYIARKIKPSNDQN